MPSERAADGAAAPRSRGGSAPPAWLRDLTLWVAAALAAVVLVVLGVAVLPGWWASVVAGWVQGVLGRGIPIGLGLGALFTLLPLGVGVLALRSGLTSRSRIALVVVALLLLLPNVVTIAVSLGRGDPRSVLAIAAPGFVGASVAGIGLVVALLLALVLIRRRSRRTRRMMTEAGERVAAANRERAREREVATEQSERSETEQADPVRPVVVEPEPDFPQEPPAEPRTR